MSLAIFFISIPVEITTKNFKVTYLIFDFSLKELKIHEKLLNNESKFFT
jgi:hypothetical protein